MTLVKPNNTIACFDVGYAEDRAIAACVTICDWRDSAPEGEYSLEIQKPNEYIPGEFFRRELPCLQQILATLPREPNIMVIDGFVDLDENGRKGLGAHLFDALDRRIPIIGVAKSGFRTASHAIPILRGKSKNPLYITAAGLSRDQAAESILQMHGTHRNPAILKRVDQLSRGAVPVQ
ncbi:MAG: endonuclease V [Planctomycetota bacterium]